MNTPDEKRKKPYAPSTILLSVESILLRYRFGSSSVYRKELYPANSIIFDSVSGTSKISIALLLCSVVIVKYRDVAVISL